MTMISAYLQAEEIDLAAHPTMQRMRISRGRYDRLFPVLPTPLAGTFESVPEFYRLLKELSDELTVEGVEDHNSFE